MDANPIATRLAALRWTKLAVWTLLAFSVMHPSAQVNQEPDLSGLTSEDRSSIESVCTYDKVMVGPAAYHRCVQKQLNTLLGSHKPDLSGLTSEDRSSIESVCTYDKVMVGPAAYHGCLRKQLDTLRIPGEAGGPRGYPRPTALVAEGQSASSRNSMPTEQQASVPQSARSRLAYFIGTWTIVGEVKASQFGPGGKFTSTQRNELKPDGSMISYWNEQLPTGGDSGQATYTFDSNKQVYVYNGVSNAGEKENSVGTVEGDTWTWTSNPVTASGEAMTGRFTVRELFPTSYTFRFEIAPQGGQWKTVREGRASKLNPRG